MAWECKAKCECQVRLDELQKQLVELRNEVQWFDYEAHGNKSRWNTNDTGMKPMVYGLQRAFDKIHLLAKKLGYSIEYEAEKTVPANIVVVKKEEQ